jgi:hypothetical protein
MTNLQDFYEKSRKLKFPKIIKVSALTKEMRKDLESWKAYLKLNNKSIEENDLVIVRVTTWYSNDKPGNYSFEKIDGNPVSYLLRKLYLQEERSADLLDSLPSDDF